MAMPRDYRYEPRGGNATFFCCRDPEVLNCGPGGSGKSVCALNKVDFLCSKYPGIRALILRKTRASLTESALVTWETGVLREGSSVLSDNLQRKNRTSYRYPNGSEVVVAGLDDPQKVFSTEFSVIYVQEAVELAQQEYEALVTRNRFGGIPYNQIFMDTNPSHSHHWLKKRTETERMDHNGKPTGKPLVTLITTTLKDNPRYWDDKGRCWTADGMAYLGKMSNLTGTMRERLLEGKWTNAEGCVYKEFDPLVHVISRKNMPIIPDHWPRYMSIDFGYTSPLCCLWAALNPQTKTLYVYREWYMTQMTVEDHANIIRKLSAGDPQPAAIICDHDREGRNVLEAVTGWGTIPAKKGRGAKEINIQEVRSRLVPDRFGNCGMYIFDDCLVRRDSGYAELGNPCCLVEEMQSYHYRPVPDRVSAKEEPADKDDHACDALAYIVAHLANHYGEFNGFRNLTPVVEKVTSTNPMQSTTPVWYPASRMYPTGK